MAQHLVGFDAVARAADIAAAQRGPDPVEFPEEVPCPELELEYLNFLNDPITDYYGAASEMTPVLTRQHVARHRCHGWGRA